jgi:multiple sugar transport system substrate-binding protein
MTMYYNEDLLKAAGMTTPPKTDADFQKVAAAMTKGGNKGFQITSGFPVQQIFQQLLHQYGGSEFNADVSQATWNSDAGVKAVQWMLDAQKKFSEPALEVDADLNSFKAGSAGMIWNGIWQTTNVTGSAVSFSGKATAAPQIGTQPATWAGMASLALPVHKKGNDACKDAGSAMLMKYILDNSVTWAKAGNVPAYNKVRNGAEIKSLQPQADLATAVENPIFPPSVPGIGDAFGPLADAITAIMTGKTTDIKAALDDAAKKSNQTLAANKQKYGDAPKS